MRLILTPEQVGSIQTLACRNAKVWDGTDYFREGVFPFVLIVDVYGDN